MINLENPNSYFIRDPYINIPKFNSQNYSGGGFDQFRVGGFKLGFWFAQQGSIYVFIILIFIYVYLMDKLDKKVLQDKEEKGS